MASRILFFKGRISSAICTKRFFADSRRCASDYVRSPQPDDDSGANKNSRKFAASAAIVGATIFGYGFYWTTRRTLFAAEQKNSEKKDPFAPPSRPDLPVYSMQQVSEHNSSEKRIWVTFGSAIYDITDFINVHPGGSEKISMASGGPLEPFWTLYAVHKKAEVLEILEEMRIGNLDAASVAILERDEHDPYSTDPPRHPALIPSSLKPYNAETPPQLLPDSFVTPNDLFFVRNHLPVPEVDEKTYVLQVGGSGLPTRNYTLDELKKRFRPVTISATIQCTGNRRNELNPIKPVKGLTWSFTAISNATWTGVRLADVLADLGLTADKLDNGGWQHVQFEGLDYDPTGQKYGASIPVEKALDRKGDVILAYEMNGTPLPRDHGYPLRVVVPGIVGARNVKWLSKIYASENESGSHWQQNDYKSFCPSTDWDTVDFKSAPAIQEAPVQSAICSPANGQKLPKGSSEIEVKGYAWSGGGRGIIRVDVSADGGKTWKPAKLQQEPAQKFSRMWAWTLWSCTFPVSSATVSQDGTIKLICKATDLSYNVQPDNAAGIWNLRGVLNNAWHRVSVSLDR